MNLVTIIENIELERTNNRQLGHAIEARLLTLKQANSALLAQVQTFVLQLEVYVGATKQEIEARDAALLALIGGE